MKLILLDGGPAAGKNTLGELLSKKMTGFGENVMLLDLDTYVEELNPKWVWENEKQKEEDLLHARRNFREGISKNLHEGNHVIAIGERFFTMEDVECVQSAIDMAHDTYLYHLSVPFALREQRLHARGPHSLIDLKKDQADRDAVKHWPGHVYENINSPEVDAENLFSLIQQNEGVI